MIYRTIDGWPDYKVTNTGLIVQVRRMFIGSRLGRRAGIIPQMKASQKGYKQVQLIDENRRRFYYVHQLVARAFLPNPKQLPKVNHKDNNPSNNSVDNLEWCTQMENVHHAIRIGAIRSKVLILIANQTNK